MIISFDEASMQTRISFWGKVIFVFLAFSYYSDDEACCPAGVLSKSLEGRNCNISAEHNEPGGGGDDIRVRDLLLFPDDRKYFPNIFLGCSNRCT